MNNWYLTLLLLTTVGCSNNFNPENSIVESAQSEYKSRLNFDAKMEPKTGIIHGAGQDIQSYTVYKDLMPEGNKPLMYMTYISITQSTDEVIAWHKKIKTELASMGNKNVVLQIGLNLTTGRDDGSGEALSVSQGKYNEQLSLFINALKDIKTPTYLRIGYEFEGKWNNYTPEGYVSAFRLISEKIKLSGIKNIATVWCSAGGSAGFISKQDLMAFYPGDDVVDWWGVDIFSPEEITNVWLVEFYKMAAERKKPVMIGETTPRYVGVEEGQKSWDTWFGPFFEMVAQNPEIKAISYINWDWVYHSNRLGFQWHDWKDARLQKNEVVKELYIREMTAPIWLHSSTDFKAKLKP